MGACFHLPKSKVIKYVTVISFRYVATFPSADLGILRDLLLSRSRKIRNKPSRSLQQALHSHRLHETSRFGQVAGQWYYVDGEIHER